MSINDNDLPTPSIEQQIIIDKFLDGGNICIKAVAGAGKTTTLLLMSQVVPEKRILIITYSKSLQLETDNKAKKLGLTNIDVRTIHSAAGYAYNMSGKVRDDKILLSLKDTPLPRNSKIHQYDIIMIDECQDIIDATRDFIYKIIQGKQVIIVGDPRQCIYEFKGASSEYLNHPDEYFDNGGSWESLYLTETYRFGPKIAGFVNNHIVGSATDIPMIGKGATNGHVTIIANNRQLLIDTIINRVDKYGINNVAIITNAVKESNKPIRSLAVDIENKVDYSPVFIDNKSDKGANSIKDRLYFGTVHSMKGLERDVIFVILDESYFKHVLTEWCELRYVPNIFYVAMTRAKKELIWFVKSCEISSDGKNRITGLRSINMNTIDSDVTKVYGKLNIDHLMHPIDQYNRTFYRGVSDIIEHRSVVDVVEMLSCFRHSSVRMCRSMNMKYDNIFYIQYKDDHNLKESVGYLYGIAIPKYVEYRITGEYHGIDKLLRNLIITTYFLANRERLNLSNIEELKQRISKGDKRLISKLGEYKQMLVMVIKNFKSLNTLDLLDILAGITDDENNFVAIRRIIENPNKSSYDIMRLVCLSEILAKPYMRNKLGNLNWINQEYLDHRCQVLYDYIGRKGGKVKFETSVGVSALHPILKHLKEPTADEDNIRVGFNQDVKDLITDWFKLNKEDRLITTTNAASVSFAEMEVKGYIDCHINNVPYEFKMSHELHDDHLLQLATYMACERKPVGYLFNYFTGYETKIEMNDDMYDKFLSALFRKAYNWTSITTFNHVGLDDEESEIDEEDGILFDYIDNTVKDNKVTENKPKRKIVKKLPINN